MLERCQRGIRINEEVGRPRANIVPIDLARAWHGGDQFVLQSDELIVRSEESLWKLKYDEVSHGIVSLFGLSNPTTVMTRERPGYTSRNDKRSG